MAAGRDPRGRPGGCGEGAGWPSWRWECGGRAEEGGSWSHGVLVGSVWGGRTGPVLEDDL